MPVAARDPRVGAAERGRQSLVADFIGAETDPPRPPPAAWPARLESRPTMVGWRSAPPGTAGCRYRSAWSRSSIQSSTVWRKLPTMIPTAASIAMAVANAPTNTDVRRNDPVRLRVASSASTPNTRRRMLAVADDNPDTSAGIANADAPMSRRAAEVAEQRFAADRLLTGCDPRASRKCSPRTTSLSIGGLSLRTRAGRAPSHPQAKPETLPKPAKGPTTVPPLLPCRSPGVPFPN